MEKLQTGLWGTAGAGLGGTQSAGISEATHSMCDLVLCVGALSAPKASLCPHIPAEGLDVSWSPKA